MARCVYPPPGLVKNLRSDDKDALIESIKREREHKAKAERRREKKERRSEKKEKRERSTEKSEIEHGEKKRAKIHNGGELKSIRYPRVEGQKSNNVLQLEKSVVTEEQKQPVYVIQSNSSDSTDNSNKRKLDSLPPSALGGSRGNILKIRLPLRKHKEPDASLATPHLCSTSGRPEDSHQQATKTTPGQLSGPTISKAAPKSTSQPKPQLPCSTSKASHQQGVKVIRGPSREQQFSGPTTRKIAPEVTFNLKKQLLCSTSDRAEASRQQILGRSSQEQQFLSSTTSKVVPEVIPKPKKQLPCSTYNRAKASRQQIFGRSSQEKQFLSSTSSKVVPEVIPKPKKQLPCSTSLRTKVASEPSQEHHFSGPAATSKIVQEVAFKPEKQLLSSTSGRVDKHAPPVKIQSEDSLYKALIEKWVPPILEMETVFHDDDDQEWLFGTKNQKSREGVVRFKARDDFSLDCGSFDQYPRAQYLAEAEVYALPLTVPF